MCFLTAVAFGMATSAEGLQTYTCWVVCVCTLDLFIPKNWHVLIGQGLGVSMEKFQSSMTMSPHVHVKPTILVPPLDLSKLEEIPQKKHRCSLGTCKVKLGLTGFDCKCGRSFCGTHRYAEAHQCSYNYQQAAKQQLENQLVKVVAAKVDIL